MFSRKFTLSEPSCYVRRKVQDPVTRGACYMAVARGKVSEGLDFMDVNGRAVIVTGVPYPPLMDTYIKLKRSYLKEISVKNGNKCMTADEWYLLQATRALNQSIGRVIRHKDDYGAILLCDQRFEGLSFKTALSSWIRPHMKKQTSFGSMIRELRHFFVTAETTLPPPRLKGPACELKAPPPVAASFDTTASRSSAVTRNTAPDVSNVTSTSEWSPDDYLVTAAGCLSAEKKTDLFGALEKPTTVINFNDMSAASSSKPLFAWSDSVQPKAKRMKLKIAPPKVIASSSSKVSGDKFAEEGNTAKPNSSQSASSNPSSSQSKPSGKVTPKREEINSYLKEVKKSLDAATYQQFSKLTCTYDKNKDYNQLVAALWQVMMGSGRNLTHLFRGECSKLKKCMIFGVVMAVCADRSGRAV
uniref:Putative regulator of telomere elongation helicase 1-like protein n=1 Tax=Reticulitermes speratus TaxID=60591 RepID=A0A2Z5TRQ6_9NEOP